jgi:hypothetical protein
MPKTYTFHVSIPGTGRVWRKVELRAEQNLAQLHMAILDAFGWFPSNLHSFYIKDPDGKVREYCLPEGAPPNLTEVRHERDLGPTSEIPDEMRRFVEIFVGHRGPDAMAKGRAWMGEEAWNMLMEQFAPPGNVLTTTLEDLDLEVGQVFRYVFNYLNEWRFRVRVHAINPDAEEADYPRVVQRVGKAPSQDASRPGRS